MENTKGDKIKEYRQKIEGKNKLVSKCGKGRKWGTKVEGRLV